MTDFVKVDGRDVGDIKIYALSTCGWCRRTKAFLADKGVAYEYVDVDLVTPDAEQERVSEEQKEYNPRGSFPTIVVNGDDVIVGYDTDALEKICEA